MKKEERLFRALGGADEALLARSERKASRANRRIAWAAALAACLLVAVGVYEFLPKEPEFPPHLVDDYPSPPHQPAEPDPVPPEMPAVRLHCLQLGIDETRSSPKFTLWLNDETYLSYVQDGVYTIMPRDQPAVPPEGELPECKMEIEYVDGGIEQTIESLQTKLESLYETVQGVDRDTADITASWPPLAQYYFRADNGVEWNSAQRDVWLIPSGEGVFVLSSSYFLEAEEGHGARFLDLANSFQPAEEDAPEWVRRLDETARRLIKAVLSDNLSDVRDLLSPDAEVVTPGEDIYAYASISKIDYISAGEPEDDPSRDPAEVEVSVQFRLGAEDAYSYLTMYLTNGGGNRWLLTWAGLEK